MTRLLPLILAVLLLPVAGSVTESRLLALLTTSVLGRAGRRHVVS